MTDFKAHQGHRLSYSEPVEQRWEVKWQYDKGEAYLERTQVVDEDVLDIFHKLYCHDCDLYLTGYNPEEIV